MIDTSVMLTSLLACIAAGVISFAMTPVVKLFAKSIGAIDVPKDGRRMHSTPIPRVGGLAIFLGFLVSVLVFGGLDAEKRAVLLGAVVIVTLGILDDVLNLKPILKLLGQILAAAIPVLNGVVIERFSNPFVSGSYIDLGIFAIPITIIWIVGLTNAVNLIDGLDGLACGVSCIAAITMFTIAVLVAETDIAIMMAALAGACIGFLPFNLNPAKIFMGDTGAMFLGYILSVASIQGLFKMYAIVSFAVPFLILGLPIMDTAMAIIRRLSKGQSPGHADREHVHHKLIDKGFDVKQSVAILYVLSAMLGLSAVLLTTSGEGRVIIFFIAVILTFFVGINTRFFGRSKKPGKGEKVQPPPAEPEQLGESGEDGDKPSLSQPAEEEHHG